MNILVHKSWHGFIAVDDDNYDGPGSLIGHGKTEEEARQDLEQQMEELRDDPEA